jgi:hypothetical protein
MTAAIDVGLPAEIAAEFETEMIARLLADGWKPTRTFSRYLCGWWQTCDCGLAVVRFDEFGDAHVDAPGWSATLNWRTPPHVVHAVIRAAVADTS